MTGTEPHGLPVIALLLIGLLLSLPIGCTTPRPTPPADPAREDYSARRVPGRQLLEVAENLVAHADTISWDADGTTRLAGRVYFNGSRSTRPERVWGWPEHAYAEVAVWYPHRRTLVLSGWPVLEYRTSTIAANTQETMVWMNGSSLRVTGGTARIAWQASGDTSESPQPQ